MSKCNFITYLKYSYQYGEAEEEADEEAEEEAEKAKGVVLQIMATVAR
jgi:hypothetical protein